MNIIHTSTSEVVSEKIKYLVKDKLSEIEEKTKEYNDLIEDLSKTLLDKYGVYCTFEIQSVYKVDCHPYGFTTKNIDGNLYTIVLKEYYEPINRTYFLSWVEYKRAILHTVSNSSTPSETIRYIEDLKKELNLLSEAINHRRSLCESVRFKFETLNKAKVDHAS